MGCIRPRFRSRSRTPGGEKSARLRDRPYYAQRRAGPEGVRRCSRGNGYGCREGRPDSRSLERVKARDQGFEVRAATFGETIRETFLEVVVGSVKSRSVKSGSRRARDSEFFDARHGEQGTDRRRRVSRFFQFASDGVARRPVRAEGRDEPVRIRGRGRVGRCRAIGGEDDGKFGFRQTFIGSTFGGFIRNASRAR